MTTSRLLIALLVVVWISVARQCSAQERLGPAPYTVFLVGAGADLTTTLLALQNPNLAEGNPLLAGGTPGLVGIKVGGTAAIALGMRHLTTHGHPRVAKVLGYVFGIYWSGLAVNNQRLTRKYAVSR